MGSNNRFAMLRDGRMEVRYLGSDYIIDASETMLRGSGTIEVTGLSLDDLHVQFHVDGVGLVRENWRRDRDVEVRKAELMLERLRSVYTPVLLSAIRELMDGNPGDGFQALLYEWPELAQYFDASSMKKDR